MRDFLQELAVAAADEFHGSSCGVAVVRDDRSSPVAASDGRAGRLESLAAESLHAEAVRSRRTVHVVDTRTDDRWPGLSRLAVAEGVGSMITGLIDVSQDDVAVGLLTVYHPEPHAFDSTERQERLDRLAAEAGRALSLATRLAASERASWHLEDALRSRAAIDQAIGILMAQNRCNADRAFEILRSASQNRNTKLRTIALELITSIGGPATPPPAFR